MANVLLVEDDEFFRAALRGTLEGRGHKVTEAENGKTAREIIKAAGAFDLVLSDIQMPFLTGVELLQWVKANKPVPFILMTGFALVMETQKAHDLGADDFLTKPFNEKELIDALARLERAKAASPISEPVKEPEPEYCKVSLDEFVSSAKIMFDVHIQLGKRMVMIGRKGDDVPKDRIQHYREKGLKYLFVKKEDFRKLVDFNMAVARTLNAKDAVSREKKVNFMRYTGEVIIQTAFMSGVNKEAFDDAKEFLTTSLDVLTDQQETFDLINSLNEHGDFIYAHSLCVSAYAVMIGRSLGWTSTQTLFKLSLCGIFHDIGKKEIERELLEKSRAFLTVAERKLIETHTTRGREILMSISTLPTDVAQVAYEHHEDNLETGFPRGIGKRDIHPLTQVIRVANIFAEQVLKNPTRAAVPPQTALEFMATHYADNIDVPAFQALRKLFEKK